MTKQTLGIVGGGQLGLLMARPAQELGWEVRVLDPTPDAPASLCATQVIGSFDNYQDVIDFAQGVDVLTFEIESAEVGALVKVESAGKEVQPPPAALVNIRDKYKQKVLMRNQGIAMGPFTNIGNKDHIAQFAEIHGYPLVLKKRFGAYDGKGNITIHDESEIDAAMQKFTGQRLYVEAWVHFQKELAVVVVRDQDGVVLPYDVVETVHTNHICDTVICPADVPTEVQKEAQSIASKVRRLFGGCGIFGVEMFYTKDGEVWFNEVAPRVHNSGHWTLGGCNISQFEQHVRAVVGETIIVPKRVSKYVVMVNILGREGGYNFDPDGVRDAQGPGVHIEIYGKASHRVGRKLGHIVVLGDDLDELLKKARRIRDMINM